MTEVVTTRIRPAGEAHSTFAVSERLESPLIAACLRAITDLPLEGVTTFGLTGRGEGHLIIDPIGNNGKHSDLFTLKADSEGRPILCVTNVEHTEIPASPDAIMILMGLIVSELEASRQARAAIAQ